LEKDIKELGSVNVQHIALPRLGSSISWNEIERLVADSYVVLVLLSAGCLRTKSFVYAMECAKMYSSVTVKLVHVWSQDYPFPSVSEQPDAVKDLFLEKVITYLEGKRQLRNIS
jgi:hypothetical protein